MKKAIFKYTNDKNEVIVSLVTVVKAMSNDTYKIEGDDTHYYVDKSQLQEFKGVLSLTGKIRKINVSESELRELNCRNVEAMALKISRCPALKSLNGAPTNVEVLTAQYESLTDLDYRYGNVGMLDIVGTKIESLKTCPKVKMLRVDDLCLPKHWLYLVGRCEKVIVIMANGDVENVTFLPTVFRAKLELIQKGINSVSTLGD